MTDMVAAEDAMLLRLKTAWDADAAAIAGALPEIVYALTHRDLMPEQRDTTKAWTRITIRHGDSRKATLANDVGAARYRRTGVLFVQIFVPFVDASSYTVCQRLAMLAQSAYEGERDTDLVYKTASIQDRSPDGGFVRRDVVVSFYWDQVK